VLEFIGALNFIAMKTTIKMLSLFVLLGISTLSVQKHASAYTSVTFQLFYDQLSPFGTWMHYPHYGYVWVPSVPAGFSPYSTGGHWVFTHFGWMWVSDYAWGWAAFHYGNWYYDPFYGWMWIPGTVWAPAWVVWSSSPGYYGWAPLGPDVNINIVISGGYRIPPERWVFVPCRYLTDPHLEQYYGPRTNNAVIIQRATIINNIYIDHHARVSYTKGPDRNEVQKSTGRSVEVAAVRSLETPGQKVGKGEVSLYRPQVQKANGHSQPAPKNMMKADEAAKVNPQRPLPKNHEVMPENTVPGNEHVQFRQSSVKGSAATKKEIERPAKDDVPEFAKVTATRSYDDGLIREKGVERVNKEAVKNNLQEKQTASTADDRVVTAVHRRAKNKETASVPGHSNKRVVSGNEMNQLVVKAQLPADLKKEGAKK
jgi:hypothetical protein